MIRLFGSQINKKTSLVWWNRLGFINVKRIRTKLQSN